jgi:hypothetical protein
MCLVYGLDVQNVLHAQKRPLTIGVGGTHVLSIWPGYPECSTCTEASINDWCGSNTCA